MMPRPVPAPLGPAIGLVPPRVEEAGGRAPRPPVPSRPASNHEPRGARNPRLGQAKITHLRYATVASPALQSGQVQAGRPLNPLRGTAARLSCRLRSGRTLRLASPHNIPRRYDAPLRAGLIGPGRSGFRYTPPGRAPFSRRGPLYELRLEGFSEVRKASSETFKTSSYVRCAYPHGGV